MKYHTIADMAKAGGKARAAKLTKEQRQAIARRAVAARWAKVKAIKDTVKTMLDNTDKDSP